MDYTKFQVPPLLRGIDHNLHFWTDLFKLAREHKAEDLGQGSPDFMPSDDIISCLREVTEWNDPPLHQYARHFGQPRLVNALSKLYEPYLQRKVDAMSEIIITFGATGGLHCAIHGLVHPGDEVIIIEPCFDPYSIYVKTAGGKPVYVSLKPTKSGQQMSSADWKFDREELASKFNEKTKLILLNTPHNPTGKIFTKEELTMIANLCKQYNVVCISDEVYEWFTYDNKQHLKIASLPGMWERTVTIGSGGKMFSVTGWKTGWCIGPRPLLYCVQHQFQLGCMNCITPVQEAFASMIELDLSRFNTSQCSLTLHAKASQEKRDRLARALTDVGMKVTVPEAGYFLLAEFSALAVDLPDGQEEKCVRFTKWLAAKKRLVAIPVSLYYCDEHKSQGKNYLRFCFIKSDDTIEKVEEIMREWKKEIVP